MMMYRQTKSGCKRISSSEDTVEIVISDYVNPHCDLNLEVSTPLFPRGTPSHDDAPPYQIWLQTVEGFRRYCLDKILTHGQTETRSQ